MEIKPKSREEIAREKLLKPGTYDFEVMRAEDRATIFTIGERPVLVQARDTAERSIAAINSISPTKKYTAFYDSIGDAAAYLEKNAPAGTRRVIVVISDGEDTNSTRISKAIQAGYVKAGKSINSLDQKTLYQMTVKNRDTAAAPAHSRAHGSRTSRGANRAARSIGAVQCAEARRGGARGR